MGENSAPTSVQRTAPRIAMVAVASLLCAAPAAPVWALDPNEVAQQWANVELQASDLNAQHQAGQITPEAFQQQSQANRAALAIIVRFVGTFPAATQAEVRRQAQLIYNNHGKPPGQGAGPIQAAVSAFKFGWLLPLLAAAAAAGAGYFGWERWRRRVPAQRSGVLASLQPQPLPGTPSRSPTAGGATLLVPAPAVTPALTASPASPASPASRALPSSAPPSSAAAPAAARDRVLAQVAAKYQASITTAMDALTETQIELQQNAQVPEGIRQELRRIGAEVYATVRELLRKRVLSLRKAIIEAALLLPLFRGFWRRLRRSLRFKILVAVIVFVVYECLTSPLSSLPRPVLILMLMITRVTLTGLVVAYLVGVAVIFLRERRAQSSGAIGALDKSAAGFRAPRLLYAYANQVATGAPGNLTYQLLRISSAADQPLVEEMAAAGQTDSDGIGAFVIWFDNAASYRCTPGGSVALRTVQPGNGLMASYGAVVTEALTRHAAELDPLLEAMRRYGDLKWRERQQKADIPRLEGLIANVSKIETIWRSVAVTDSVFDFLIRRIDLFSLRENATPNGLLLCGYPDNGKEFLARKVAESTFAQFIKPTAEQLASPQNIRDLWASLMPRRPVVVFIDYADQVFARIGDQNSAGRDATLAWLEEWSRHKPSETGIWVVMSAESEDKLHPRVLAQMGGSKIEIKPPDTAGRELILANAIRENQLPGTAPRWLIEKTGGFSVRELREIVRETRMRSVPDSPTEAQWREAQASVRTPTGGDGENTWESLILAPATISQLKTVCVSLQNMESMRRQGVALPKGALLFGPPGTGKTQIAKTLAQESGLSFLSASTADLKAGYIGQSGQNTKDLFDRARARAPCILFIDEIDAVCPTRGGPESDQFTVEIINQMLQETEGVKSTAQHVYVLGATNRPQAVEAAIRSRLKESIEVPLPDAAQRQQLFKVFLRRFKKIDFNIETVTGELAARTKKMGGRALLGIVENAGQRAVQRAFQNDTPDNIVLSREDLLGEVQPKGTGGPSAAELAKIWAQIVLPPQIKEDILDKIRSFNRADNLAPRGLLLYGPPGTGKTEIAKRIADSASCKFMELKGPDLKAGYVGQSGERVKQKWAEARSYGGCVMFIDECEGVFGRRGGTGTDSASEELVQAFLAEWAGFDSEEQRVWVVGATNRRELLDEAIVQRFETAIAIELPGPAERLQILNLEMQKLGRSIPIPAFLERPTTGMSGRILSMLTREICMAADKQGGVATEALWREVLKRHVKGGSDAVDQAATWDSLILAPETIAQLKTLCDSLQNLESLRKQGVAVPKGALLYGPPGTGKTQIARTLANESGLQFLAAATADLKGGTIGISGQKTRELFDRARERAPCVLFIDEIDAVCPARGSAESDQFTNEIVNQFLQETEGVKASARHVYVLAATNRPEAVDSAVRSRLKDSISIPNPDEAQRRQLFKLFLGKLKVNFDIDEVSAELARRSKNLGGRALSAIVERASQQSVQRAFKNGTPDAIVLTREDLLPDVDPQAKQLPEAELQKIWSQIVLPPALKADLMEKVRLFNRADKLAPRGLLLYGPPGTGKTEIAKRIADSVSCKFMDLRVPDLKAGYIGQTGERVRKKWEEARAYGRCVMFIDECEGVFGRRGGLNSDSFVEELVQAFLAEWVGVGNEDQRVWVVGATNRRELLDEAIAQRFGPPVAVELPGPAERLQILALEMQKIERTLEIPAFLGQATTGMAGRQLQTLAREICMQAEAQGGVATDDMWREVLKRHVKSGSDAVEQGARWDSLVLSDALLDKLRTLCDTLRNADEFKAQGFEVPKGALLYGPPGTGKTQIARTLANESGLQFIAASTADLKGGYVGQSGQKTREIFQRARDRAPSILFIDEIDALCPTRGGINTDSFTDEIITQILQEMDGVKATERQVFVLAATNRVDAIEPAIRSRFEEEIEIGNPDSAQRQRLFRQLLAKLRVDFDRDAVTAELAALTPNIAGRDIRSVIRRASQLAVRRAGGDPKSVMLTRADLLSSVPAARTT
jgi:SpoVK/Ycf46/Vps4 family AAA+-type ATPase